MKSIVRSVLGLVLILGWWTFTGNSISTNPALENIPASVWGGGAGTLVIEAETSSAARVVVDFSRDDQDDRLSSYEDIAAGTHRWTIDVPSDTGGYVELGAVDPKPGDRLNFRILVNGRTVFEDSDQLEAALEPGYAFFVQAYIDDYAKGRLEEDD